MDMTPAGMKEIQEEDWNQEALDQEYHLTFYQVSKLLRIAGEMDENTPVSAIWPFAGTDTENTPLWHAPFVVSTSCLNNLAQDRQLLDMELIVMEPLADGTGYQATEKGMAYAKWYVGTLEGLGFSHPALPSVNRRQARSLA